MKIYRFFAFAVVAGALSLPSCSRQTITPNQQTGRADNMALGNPSKATAEVNNENNYLINRPQYTLSYNKSRNTANWVSWHLSKEWRGTAQRQENFRPDNALPADWYHVTPGDYTNTGFDRGHLCPSDDRDASTEDNMATFLMTNIIPQAPDNNRIPWKNLEDYGRNLVEDGNELYIIAGVYGKGGSGSNGGTTQTLTKGNITVPSRIWKIIVVLPEGANDLQRISTSTRVIAVDIPNKQSAKELPWHKYRVSIDDIESATGYDFLSSIPVSLQTVLEAKTDNETVTQ